MIPGARGLRLVCRNATAGALQGDRLVGELGIRVPGRVVNYAVGDEMLGLFGECG